MIEWGLSRKERLCKTGDIKNLFSNGTRYNVKGAAAVVAPNALPFNRIMIIPAKKFGIAVERNRIRRIGKEIFRLSKQDLKHGFDIALIYYPGDYGHEQRRKQFFSLLRQAGIC